MICWPLKDDQPINAALLSTREQPLAFELLQIRKAEAMGPAMRDLTIKITGSKEDFEAELGNVFGRCFGPEGERVRRNVMDMSKELRMEKKAKAAEVISQLAMI